MDIVLPWWLATPLLIALTTLPVRFAVSLLETEYGNWKNSFRVALVGVGLTWIAVLFIPNAFLGLLVYPVVFTLAACFILRLSWLNSVLVSVMASGFASLVAILFARLGWVLWPLWTW
ncbi:MAG: hypothetical protein GKR89_06900 [Candidatus Latescibacteria bacterium]|nr:hypothetical protein [Candidatus Latescibacterota bacterium]